MSELVLPEDPHIVLNPDQLAVAGKAIRDLGGAMVTLQQGLRDANGVPEELAVSCLKVSEYYLKDLAKALGIQTNGTKELEERHAMLREANLRIRELEAQLGRGQSAQLTQLSVKALAERVNYWWRRDGFGHVSKTDFGSYGVMLDLSCTLFGRFLLLDSNTPVSDREAKARWYASLAERGFVLVVEKGEREPSVDDCDASREALRQLIVAKLPSAKIQKFDNQGARGNHVLRGVTVYVSNYEDLANLPTPPAEQKA